MYRGVLRLKGNDGKAIQDLYTPKTYKTEQKALDMAKIMSALFPSVATYVVVAEQVKEILICDDCQEIHDNEVVTACTMCGSKQLTKAEMEVLI